MVDLKSGDLTKRLGFGTLGTYQVGNEQSANTVDNDSVPETTMITRAVPDNVAVKIAEIDSIAICPQGRYLAAAYDQVDERGTNTGEGHGAVRLVDLETEQELVLLRGEIGIGVSGSPDAADSIFSFDASGRHLAWCGRDGVSILNLDSINFGSTIYGYGRAAISPDGKEIATSDGVVQVTEVKTERRIGKRMGDAVLKPLGIAFSRDGTRVAGGVQGGSWNVPIWNWNTGERLASLDNSRSAPESMAFSPSDRLVMIVSSGMISLCDATTGKSVVELQRENAELFCGAFNPVEKLFATGGSKKIEDGEGGEVVIWDGATWKPTIVLQGLDRAATSVAWSPDGKWIAACSNARSNSGPPRTNALHTVFVWDVKTGKERLRLRGHAAEVNAVLFTPDSRRLLSASSDATIKVWDLQLGLEVMTLQAGSDPLVSLSFGNGSDMLAAGSVRRRQGLSWHDSSSQRKIHIWSARPLDSAPHERNHPLLEKLPGRRYEPPPSLDALYDLAQKHAEAGRLSEALNTYVKTLRRVRAELSSDQLDWLSWIEKLGSALSTSNEFEQSIELMEEALKQREANQGRNHPETQSVVFQLGVVCEKSGQYDKAILLLEKVHDTSKTNSKVFFNHQFLANAYIKAGRTADSIRIIGEDLEKFRGFYPSGSQEIGNRLSLYGKMLSDAGAYAESVPLLRECMKIREAGQPNAWNTFNVQSLLGEILFRMALTEENAQEKAKLLAEAESLMVSGYDGLKARKATIPPQSAALVSEALNRVIDFLTSQGRLDEARQYETQRQESQR